MKTDEKNIRDFDGIRACLRSFGRLHGRWGRRRQLRQKKVYKIGVSQLVEHPALDAAYDGFVDGLKEKGYVDGDNIELDFNNAQNEQSNCVTIANKLVGNKSDLILAIGTTAAVAVAQATQDIPVLITAITDPKDAGLVKSNEKPNTNVTGTSDLTPVKQQIALIPRILPNAKTVGFLYSSSESNSEFIVNLAKTEAKKIGLKTVEKTISNSNEIQQAAKALVPLCDVIYLPNDNTIASGMATVTQVTKPAKKPIITGERGMMDIGGIATYNTNYYNLGKQTALMAVDILVNGKKPADMPIQYQQTFELVLNKSFAKDIGVTFPQDVLDEEKSFASSSAAAGSGSGSSGSSAGSSPSAPSAGSSQSGSSATSAKSSS